MLIRQSFIDHVSRVGKNPDMHGPFGLAWQMDIDAIRLAHDIPAGMDATIMYWLVYAPDFHSFWHSYYVAAQHLKPLADGKTAAIYIAGATHEMSVFALDPDYDPADQLMMRMAGKDYRLHPVNFAAQMVNQTDATAIQRVVNAVKMIVDGELSPDSDHISQWVALFGNSNVRGAQS